MTMTIINLLIKTLECEADWEKKQKQEFLVMYQYLYYAL